MATNQAFKNIFDTLTRSAFLEGNAMLSALTAIKQETQDEIEVKFNALAGEDAKINSVLTMLQKITDAEPGSEEWDEGQNLYELISSKYVALADRVGANEAKTADLEQLAAGMAQDLSAYNSSILEKVDKEIAERKTAVTELQNQVDTNKSNIETANLARSEALSAVNEAIEQGVVDRGSLTTRLTTAEGKVTALKTEQEQLKSGLTTATQNIGLLVIKNDGLISRVETLEGYFVSIGDGTEIANEFTRGMQGLPSAYGHQVA